MIAGTDPTAWSIPSSDPADAGRAAAQAATLPHRAWVEHHMAMPWSIHVRGPACDSPRTTDAVARAYAEVARVDAELSPFRPDSALSRYRAGTSALTTSASLAEVHRLCLIARERTGGAFDAWGWRGGFDPTGLTKGWAIDRALAELDGVAGDVAVGAGGDLAVRSSSGLPWRVGIEDPADRRAVLAWVDVRDGGIATSGPAARRGHIVDPRSGGAATGVATATVVAPTAMWADVWATTAVVLGDDGASTLRRLPGTAGVIVLTNGSVHRWAA